MDKANLKKIEEILESDGLKRYFNDSLDFADKIGNVGDYINKSYKIAEAIINKKDKNNRLKKYIGEQINNNSKPIDKKYTSYDSRLADEVVKKGIEHKKKLNSMNNDFKKDENLKELELTQDEISALFLYINFKSIKGKINNNNKNGQRGGLNVTEMFHNAKDGFLNMKHGIEGAIENIKYFYIDNHIGNIIKSIITIGVGGVIIFEAPEIAVALGAIFAISVMASLSIGHGGGNEGESPEGESPEGESPEGESPEENIRRLLELGATAVINKYEKHLNDAYEEFKNNTLFNKVGTQNPNEERNTRLYELEKRFENITGKKPGQPQAEAEAEAEAEGGKRRTRKAKKAKKRSTKKAKKSAKRKARKARKSRR
jgi:hypothetical protein